MFIWNHDFRCSPLLHVQLSYLNGTFNCFWCVNPKTRKNAQFHKQNIVSFLVQGKQQSHQHGFSCSMPLSQLTRKNRSQLRVYPQRQNLNILLCGSSYTSIVGIFHHFNYTLTKYKSTSRMLKHVNMGMLASQLTAKALMVTITECLQSTHG